MTLSEDLFVSNYVPVTTDSVDITPPGRITDVDIEDIYTEKTAFGESRNFTITWTAPGDDYAVGQGKTKVEFCIPTILTPTIHLRL